METCSTEILHPKLLTILIKTKNILAAPSFPPFPPSIIYWQRFFPIAWQIKRFLSAKTETGSLSTFVHQTCLCTIFVK